MMSEKKEIKIIIASNNEGKIQEIKQILLGFQVCSMREVGISLKPKEDADSFLGNAKIKAQALYTEVLRQKLEEDFFVLSDDSGICVDALNGEPGIFSARYAQVKNKTIKEPSDEENRQCLIWALKSKNLEESQGYFLASMVLIGKYHHKEIYFEAEGKTQGKFFTQEKGDYGFGYDSLFIPDSFSRTMAEMESKEKNKISHRFKALNQIANQLKGYLSE